MLGYSDSVRDGSSLASDSQLISTVLELEVIFMCGICVVYVRLFKIIVV